MFAIVEFERKKCSVVPINWLDKNQEKCFWPNGYSSKEDFLTKVKKSESPKKAWRNYSIIKIHKILDTYDDADQQLDKILNSSAESSDEKGHSSSFTLMNMENSKRRIDSPDNVVNYDSSSDFSDKEEDVVQEASTVTNNTSFTETNLLETILKRVEHVATVQNQHSIVLNNILKLNETTTIKALQKPDDVPLFPIDCKRSYKLCEEFLKKTDNFNYVKNRLACIGGANVRNAVMNMLKYLLTDQVAMKFNWINRDSKKKAFKNTLMCNVIQEAVMTAYCRQDRTDANNKTVEDAIKDWLKLAKARFDTKQKRLRQN